MNHCAMPPSCLGDEDVCACPCLPCVNARAGADTVRASDRAVETVALVRRLAEEHQRYAIALLTIAGQAHEDVLGEQLLARLARAALTGAS